MIYAGQTIENPVTGERITFRKTAADTNGEYVEIILELAADGAVPGTHVHPKQVEIFEVVSGRMKFRLGMKKVYAGPGETVVVPKGVVHAYKNVGASVGIVVNLPNRLYMGQGRREPVDEIRHEDDPATPYRLED